MAAAASITRLRNLPFIEHRELRHYLGVTGLIVNPIKIAAWSRAGTLLGPFAYAKTKRSGCSIVPRMPAEQRNRANIRK